MINSIETRDVVVRVRPQKIAVIIAEDVGRESFLVVIDFLSRIWGGKYCSIFVVYDPNGDSNIQENLVRTHPDIILCVGLDGVKWSKIADQCCQPRGLGVLDRSYIKQIYETNPHKLILTESLVKEAMDRFPDMKRDNLYLFSRDASQNISIFTTTSFGLVPDNEVDNYANALKAKANSLPEDNISCYLKTCIDMSKRWSWLDFASEHLSRYQLFSDFAIPPTIVVCADKINDYALFWNIRTQIGVGSSGKIVLFPESEIDSRESIEALCEWTIKSPINANYCVLRTSSVGKGRLDNLARRLRPRLKARFEHVDVKIGSNLAPVVVPYEKEVHSRVYISGNCVRFDVTKPGFVEFLRSFDSWICDFVKESESGRALGDLVLPPRSSAIQVLNAPTPPRFNLNVDVIRWGPDALNVKCSSHNPTFSFSIPSAEELITEILKEFGVIVIKDEKQVRYNQILRMVGGLKSAFLTFSGSSLKVLNTFLFDELGDKNKRPLTLGEIKSRARLRSTGKENTNPVLKILNDYLPEHAKSVANQRFREYFEQNISRGKKEKRIVDRLIQQGVLKRKWKLERCQSCDQAYWVEHIDINKSVKCPGCDNVITLKGQVTLGYELNELVRRGIQEGIVPVILTANFLYNTTSEGFIWLPGVKCKIDKTSMDFDILAVCDGHILAAECKNLEHSTLKSKIWIKVIQQIQTTILLAKQVGVEAFVFASLSEEYSKSFKEKIRKMAGSEMSVTFLSKADLQSGRKSTTAPDGKSVPFFLEDILIGDRPKIKKKRKRKGKRIIRF